MLREIEQAIADTRTQRIYGPLLTGNIDSRDEAMAAAVVAVITDNRISLRDAIGESFDGCLITDENAAAAVIRWIGGE